MKIEQQNIESLIPYALNNRDHDSQQIERIASSITEFGFNQPIVIDESNVILVGHGRLEAAKTLGLKKVPVLRKEGLSDTQKRAYRLLDNKLQNDSSWNLESLEVELSALAENSFDINHWGLNELEKLFLAEDLQETKVSENSELDLTREEQYKLIVVFTNEADFLACQRAVNNLQPTPAIGLKSLLDV
jgi:hypothetical protein